MFCRNKIHMFLVGENLKVYHAHRHMPDILAYPEVPSMLLSVASNTYTIKSLLIYSFPVRTRKALLLVA